MVWPWKAGDYLKRRQLIHFRIVWMAFCARDNHEMRRARARTRQMASRLWEKESCFFPTPEAQQNYYRQGMASYADL